MIKRFLLPHLSEPFFRLVTSITARIGSKGANLQELLIFHGHKQTRPMLSAQKKRLQTPKKVPISSKSLQVTQPSLVELIHAFPWVFPHFPMAFPSSSMAFSARRPAGPGYQLGSGTDSPAPPSSCHARREAAPHRKPKGWDFLRGELLTGDMGLTLL